jgi:hypothetical protein
MRLAALQSVLSAEVADALGFLLPPDFPVSREPVWFDLDTVPRPLASSGSSSPELYLLYRVLPLRTCPARKVRGAFLGVPFPIATSTERVHYRAGFPVPTLRSALSVSHALDGLLLSLLCGFVSPRSHVRDSPFRGLLLLPSRTTSSMARALLSLCDRLLPSSCLAGAVFGRPAFRALIRAAVRDHRQSV